MLLIVPQILVALVALGMGLAFVSADRASPTSRALALALSFLGIAIVANIGYLRLVPSGVDSLPGWLALPEGLAMIAFLEWLLRVRRMLPTASLNVSGGDHMLRLGQAAGALYVLLALLFPQQRAHDFLFALSTPGVLGRAGFWLFATPVLFSSLTGLLSVMLLLRRRPDHGERVRVLAMAGSVPFLTAGFVLRPEISAISVALGEMIFLVGAVHYHVLQGQRGEFMARFLSTQVADLVRSRGLQAAMQQNDLEITALAVDLRGFTAYAQAHPAARVIEVLRDYYDAVGRVVAEFGGTIKDYAGDGILILVGAPLPQPDHAARALRMARRIRTVVAAVTQRWSGPAQPLGAGIGIASGRVVVGVIGTSSRLEYTAVGSAVNLAARLCEQAQDGEVLVDSRTRELASDAALQPRASLQVKGFAAPVSPYALMDSAAE